jgi:Heparinase II/III-like protein/Heparinase II/III N-terminus
VANILNRLRGRTLNELRVRGLQALTARLERVLPVRSSGGLAQDHPPVQLAQDRWFAAFRWQDARAICAAVARQDPQLLASLRELSDGLEHGVMPLLGYDSLAVGNPPHWHTDAASGQQSPRRHWSLIDHLDVALVGDHKVLWELNRHQYLLAPALCWLDEQDARRFALIEAHLDSWLRDNPRGEGVNWVSSLEVAYRAITWCWLLWMLREAPWTPRLRARLLASLADHAAHIERYLSTYFSPNTHLTGEALGLFYVGTLLPPSRATDRWRRKGAQILEACLDRQVHEDGVYFEQSTQYQRYTLEIYLHYQLLGAASGWAVSPQVRITLGRLAEVLRSVCSAAGRIPLIGDDDGGLLLPLDQRPPDDVRALLLALGVTLERPELVFADRSPPSYAYWLCGVAQTERFLQMPLAPPRWRDAHYASGGLAILRDGWARRDAVAVVDAGPHGALNCGHSHADALSMTLSLGERELFIERGTLTYVGPQRNEFRATRSHNTVEVDEESTVLPAEPFRWRAIPERADACVFSAAGCSGLIGAARGHIGGERPSLHRRIVLHQRGGAWVVHDRLWRRGAERGVLRWQLAPDLRAERQTVTGFLIRDAAGTPVATVYAPLATTLGVVSREVSLRFGHHTTAQCLEITLPAALEGLTVIVPGAAVDLTALRRPVPGEARTFDWSDQLGRHRVSLEGMSHYTDWPAGIDSPVLSWGIDSTPNDRGSGFAPDRLLFAATSMPQLAPEQLITARAATSGTMRVFERKSTDWMEMPVARVGRGND